MKGCNVILIYDKKEENVLMCHRRKDPYKGLLNLIGGKIEQDETSMDAAYRELYEETGIQKKDVRLVHLMDFTYYLDDITLEVYVGKLYEDIEVYGEENELCWISKNENFYDMDRFAGEGNIAHMMNKVDHELLKNR